MIKLCQILCSMIKRSKDTRAQPTYNGLIMSYTHTWCAHIQIGKYAPPPPPKKKNHMKLLRKNLVEMLDHHGWTVSSIQLYLYMFIRSEGEGNYSKVAVYIPPVACDIMTCPQEEEWPSVTKPISLPDSSCVCTPLGL